MSEVDISDLNDLQKKAYNMLCESKNMFISGSAGTGKSYLIEKYYNYAVNKYTTEKVFKTSSTGVSAILINGKTLHSWAGIMLGEGTVEQLVKGMKLFPKLRWLKAKVLFIDEISMISPDLFDKLEEIARIIRANDKPFGGIQIVITGDFFQLPVVKCERFCFESKSWHKVIEHSVNLTEIIRQKDPVFQALLNQVRYGFISDSNSELLDSRVEVELKNDAGIEPTILYAKNIDVDNLNKQKLQELISKDKVYTYNANYVNRNLGTTPQEYTKQLENFQKYEKNIPNKIFLAKGAQVIFKKNIDDEVANGTRGVVIDFKTVIDSPVEYPVVKLLNGNTRIVTPVEFEYQVKNEFKFIKKQIPLKLAWATTIHSCQGSTLDYVKADIGSSIFTYGQVYVVLSRVKTLEGLTLIGYNRNSIAAHPSVLLEYSDQY